MSLPETIPLLISSTAVATPTTFPLTSPDTQAHLYNVSIADSTHAALACTAAAKALPQLPPPATRATLLRSSAAALKTLTPILTSAIRAEIGATDPWISFNISTAHTLLLHLATLLETAPPATTFPPSATPGMTAKAVPTPYGVVLSIAPWNAPLLLAARAVAWPLAAGNTVVLKGSELSPYTHFLLASIFTSEHGWPAGAVSLLLHDRAGAEVLTRALITNPAIKKVNFTGSTAVGRKIAGLAGEALKPVLLELGGKAPVIVCEDGDVAAAAKVVAAGACGLSGQVCMSSERVMVHASLLDKFVALLKEEVAAAFGGSQVLVLGGAPARVRGLIEDAVASGAEVLLGGNAVQGGFENTIVLLKNTSTCLWREESFAPVVCVLEFTEEEEALRLANDTEYGLSAAVWTRDVERGERLAERLEAGMVHVNGSTIHDECGLQHGGVKCSGWGRFGGGEEGWKEWVTVKTVTVTER